MKIVESHKFRKSFNSLDISVKRKTQKQFNLFLQNVFHPSLNTEKLEPKNKNIWSFRIDKNFRVIFTFTDKEKIYILDIGPHNIYKKIK
ncbi:MAG: hypothetical protein UR27_C0024G0007 [Candidatus Peregrinibacteria bacterium GW2011_GWA2_33_10]|nr:MAG: hypothetical protein UR27_C0024G0007 [Candidatus Peregrinibacteria bacterium GW2011_GWA2_33_10]KKP38299.1 MAG: hypothetical protein UR30_C0021G0007 [Candidatus Peregrinibacteria bacterium GW2011_GWC2_33_13]